VPIYAYATKCGHADCIDEAHQRGAEMFIDFLVDMAIEDAKARIQDGTYAKELAADHAARPATPRVEAQPESTRYMRPEFDIEVVIPGVNSKRRPRTPPSARIKTDN
jgi:hypothetical protein